MISLCISLLAAGCGGAGDEADDTAPPDEVADSELHTDNAKAAFNFFVGKGLTQTEAAAIVGNLQQESNIQPDAVQPGGPGRGIAQWSVGARWNGQPNDNLASFARTRGESSASLSAQLDFIWWELVNYSKYGLSRLRAAKSLASAVVAFQTDYEICGTCAQSKRIAYAQAALRTYGH